MDSCSSHLYLIYVLVKLLYRGIFKSLERRTLPIYLSINFQLKTLLISFILNPTEMFQNIVEVQEYHH